MAADLIAAEPNARAKLPRKLIWSLVAAVPEQTRHPRKLRHPIKLWHPMKLLPEQTKHPNKMPNKFYPNKEVPDQIITRTSSLLRRYPNKLDR